MPLRIPDELNEKRLIVIYLDKFLGFSPVIFTPVPVE
jgi:hypothetical protein